MVVGRCAPLVVAAAPCRDHGRNHVCDHCVAAADLVAPNGVAASVADCCEGAVCVTEKCGCIDHQTVASIDGLPSFRPLILVDPLPQNPSYNDKASEEIGVVGVGKFP